MQLVDQADRESTSRLSVLAQSCAWIAAALGLNRQYARFLTLVFALFGAFLVSVGYFYLKDHEAQYRELAERELSAIAELKAGELARWRAEAALYEANAQLHQLTQRLSREHEAQSSVLSRELHDEFGQMLTSLKMDLSLAAEEFGGDNPELKQQLALSMALVDASVESVHSIAARLRPRILDELGLLPAIDWLVHDFRERTGIDAEFVASAPVDALGQERATAVFRIVQESLSNIGRHADAKRIDIGLDAKEGWLTVEIRDDGRGVGDKAMSSYESIGLLGMRERAFGAGGELAIESVPGKGTLVTLSLPLREQTV